MKTILLNLALLLVASLSYGNPIDPPVGKITESKTSNQDVRWGAPAVIIGNTIHCGYNNTLCMIIFTEPKKPIEAPSRILVKVNDKLSTVFTASSKFEEIKGEKGNSILTFSDIVTEISEK